MAVNWKGRKGKKRWGWAQRKCIGRLVSKPPYRILIVQKSTLGFSGVLDSKHGSSSYSSRTGSSSNNKSVMMPRLVKEPGGGNRAVGKRSRNIGHSSSSSILHTRNGNSNRRKAEGSSHSHKGRGGTPTKTGLNEGVKKSMSSSFSTGQLPVVKSTR